MKFKIVSCFFHDNLTLPKSTEMLIRAGLGLAPSGYRSAALHFQLSHPQTLEMSFIQLKRARYFRDNLTLRDSWTGMFFVTYCQKITSIFFFQILIKSKLKLKNFRRVWLRTKTIQKFYIYEILKSITFRVFLYQELHFCNYYNHIKVKCLDKI